MRRVRNRKTFTDKEMETAARLGIWYSIIRGNKSGFLGAELEGITENWWARQPTPTEWKRYKKAIQKWMDKVYPPDALK